MAIEGAELAGEPAAQVDAATDDGQVDDLSRSLLQLVGGSVIMILLTVVTGALGSRLLGPAGRGESGAIVALLTYSGLAGSLGFWGGLTLEDYARGLRAWREDPGEPLTWGPFQVMGELGRGLTGAVYAATLAGRACALKVLPS